LELASGQFGSRTVCEVSGIHGSERLACAQQDFGRRRTEVLEPERDFAPDSAQDDLLLRILEHARDGSRELCGRDGACVVARDLDASGKTSAVEVRNESSEGAEER
jgi:hypothetical protein